MFNSRLFSADRPPLSRSLILTLIVLSVLSVFIMHLKSGVVTTELAWTLSLVSILLFVSAWFVISKEQMEDSPAQQVVVKERNSLFNGGILLATCGALVGILNAYMSSFGAASSIAVLVAYFAMGFFHCTGKNRFASLVVTPVLCASVFTGTAGLLGDSAIGYFPAVIVLLLTFIVRITIITEEEIREKFSGKNDDVIFLKFRKRLAWTASIFFLFGVVSFWPWLGMLYSDAYFWLLVFGVMLPLVFFWGRLRQPRAEGPLLALLRFNRVSPIIAAILLIAFAIG